MGKDSILRWLWVGEAGGRGLERGLFIGKDWGVGEA